MLRDKSHKKGIIAIVCTACAVALIAVSLNSSLKNQPSTETNNILSLSSTPQIELYLGQSCGVCTHDESFTEPVIPEGKYYPNGDRNADYYMEIKNGTFCLRWQDGSVASDDRVWGGEREYKVVTFHYTDDVMLCSEWHEYTDEEREQNGTLDKYSVIHGVSVTFRDGKAYIMPPAFRAGEGNVIRTDPSMQLSIPDENI